MVQFKITCPECGAVIATNSPEAAILELCPSCGHHVWDKFDALMAEASMQSNSALRGNHARMNN